MNVKLIDELSLLKRSSVRIRQLLKGGLLQSKLTSILWDVPLSAAIHSLLVDLSACFEHFPVGPEPYSLHLQVLR